MIIHCTNVSTNGRVQSVVCLLTFIVLNLFTEKDFPIVHICMCVCVFVCEKRDGKL